MKFNFHPDALHEYSEAALYYTSVSPALAISFVTQIEDGINQILTYPEAWTEIEENIRRYLTKQFPYGIYYTIESDDSILIQAIMHLSRKPGYWRDRLNK